MKRFSAIFYVIRGVLLAALVTVVSCSPVVTKRLSILETTDIHGVILPYDFVMDQKLDYSMASTYTYLKQQRQISDNVIILDNGDNLQGQPEVYYYNFIDTVSPHFLPLVMNYMGYSAGTVGNHDIETGHSVYDRLRKQYSFPLLAANAVNTKTGEPYFKPYVILHKAGLKIAVMGMVTPAIPTWLPPELYSGIEFRDMEETARKWMPAILNEKPDLVVGLFHSGWNRNEENQSGKSGPHENGSASVAYNVPGFDVIFNGHDHMVANEKFVNKSGDTVLILNGGSRSEKIAEADILLKGKKNKWEHKQLNGEIINTSDYKPDKEFLEKFKQQDDIISEYVKRVIGNSPSDASSREAYFGPCAFMDMLHGIQLEITGADISFAAPLSFDVSIKKGPVTVGDMFKLYRFENMLYTMSMTGKEIRKYLEYSYAAWFNTMHNQDDHLIRFRTGNDGKPIINDGKAFLKAQSYNFDSAAGIDYIVDVSKPEGSRITIQKFSDGRPFDENKTYKVAVNSYRGNGGGGLITEGAGISKDDLQKRLITSTDRDLRYYILKSTEKKGTIFAKPLNNWKVIPYEWVSKARPDDYRLMFGSDK